MRVWTSTGTGAGKATGTGTDAGHSTCVLSKGALRYNVYILTKCKHSTSPVTAVSLRSKYSRPLHGARHSMFSRKLAFEHMTRVTKCALKRGVNRLMSTCKPKHAASGGCVVEGCVFVSCSLAGRRNRNCG